MEWMLGCVDQVRQPEPSSQRQGPKLPGSRDFRYAILRTQLAAEQDVRHRGVDHGLTNPEYPRTPDGRYFVVRGRLWRLSNPGLPLAERERLVHELMAARRAVQKAKGNADALRAARSSVDAAKRALGERGPPWWTDGAPDYNRHMAANTPYAGWFETVVMQDRGL